MKNLALLLAITLLLSSCSLMNKEKVKTIESPIIWEEVSVDTDLEKDENDSVENNVKEDIQSEEENSDAVINSSTDTPIEMKKEDTTSIETEVTSELESDIESEEALSEVFNEIEELFELAEQNGGQ